MQRRARAAEQAPPEGVRQVEPLVEVVERLGLALVVVGHVRPLGEEGLLGIAEGDRRAGRLAAAAGRRRGRLARLGRPAARFLSVIALRAAATACSSAAVTGGVAGGGVGLAGGGVGLAGGGSNRATGTRAAGDDPTSTTMDGIGALGALGGGGGGGETM